MSNTPLTCSCSPHPLCHNCHVELTLFAVPSPAGAVCASCAYGRRLP